MSEDIVLALEGLPSWVRVILLAMIPITEYQLSIPLGIHEYNLSPWIVFGLSVLGAAIPFLVIYFLLEWVRNLISQHLPALLRPLDYQLARAKAKLHDNYNKYGMIALFILLVIPFPLTGVWTASLAAVALKIPFKEAAIGILLGMVGGVTVITLLSLAGGAVVETAV